MTRTKGPIGKLIVPLRDARGHRLPRMLDRQGREVPYASVTDAMLRTGAVYAACQCWCNCDHAARSFQPDSSALPDLCFSCMEPEPEHAKPEREVAE